MKRLLVITMLLTVCATGVWAQRSGGDVIGAPVYYDTLGNVIGSTAPADSFYHRPKHHYFNRMEDEFSSVFLEGAVLFAENDMAVGGQVAWVPRHWGVYCGGLAGIMYQYFTVGPVARLSDCGNRIDWQMYAGMVVSRRMGGEIGFRIAMPRQWGDFCWTSASFAAGYVNRYAYFTLGLSLTFSSIVAISIW